MIKNRPQAKEIALHAEAADLSDGDRGDEAPGPELFPTVYIRQMDLDGRQGDRRYGVTNGNTRVGVCCRIYKNTMAGAGSGMYPLDEAALRVGLENVQLDPELARQSRERSIDFRQRHLSIHTRLAGTQQVQVRPMQHKYFQWPSV